MGPRNNNSLDRFFSYASWPLLCAALEILMIAVVSMFSEAVFSLYYYLWLYSLILLPPVFELDDCVLLLLLLRKEVQTCYN